MLKNIAALTSGSAISQLTLLLVYPLLTFLYNPVEIGEFAIILSILSICSIIGSARYELGIPLPKSQSELLKLSIMSAVILLIFCSAIAITIIFLFFRDTEVLFWDKIENTKLLFLLPIAILIQGALNILTQLAIRFSEFKLLAWTKIYQSFLISILQLTLYMIGSFGLLIAQILTQAFVVFRMLKKMRIKLSLRLLMNNFSFGILKKYIDLPKYSMPSGLLGALGQHSPLIIIGSLYDLKYAGLYALATKLTFTPVAVLTGALSSVFYSYASRRKEKAELGYTLKILSSFLIKAALPVFLLAHLLIADFFQLLFGDEWQEAGNLAELLIPWICMMLIVSPFQCYFLILKREHEMMIFHVIFLTLRISAIVLGSYWGGIEGAINLFSIVSALTWLIILLRIYQIMGMRLDSIISSSIPAFSLMLIIYSIFSISDLVPIYEILGTFFVGVILLLILFLYFIFIIAPALKKIKGLI